MWIERHSGSNPVRTGLVFSVLLRCFSIEFCQVMLGGALSRFQQRRGELTTVNPNMYPATSPSKPLHRDM